MADTKKAFIPASELTWKNRTSVTPEDIQVVRAMNNFTVPACNDLSTEDLMGIIGESLVFEVAFHTDAAHDGESAGSTVAGFIIAFDGGKNYTSPNYRFFQNKYGVGKFVYVDRIVVTPNMHGRAIGRTLYKRVVELTASSEKSADAEEEQAAPLTLCCEVNLQPPNPDSIAFHDKLGFSSVGEQETEGGAKRVTLLTRKLAAEGL